MAHEFRQLAGLTPLELQRGLQAAPVAADHLYFVRYRKHERRFIGSGQKDSDNRACGQKVARQSPEGDQ